jgi:hypothetical protein
MQTQDEVTKLLGRIYEKKVVLFVGNGASIEAGGPKTGELVEQIKRSFPDAQYKNDDFIQTCTDVLETTLTSRIDLENLIVKTLYDLKPSSFHLELPLHFWRAIYTTNYDDLIEQGYRGVEKRVQGCDTVFSDTDSMMLNDDEKVKLFKLMGCITSKHPDSKLIITRSDYNAILRNRPRLFRTLYDIMKDGTILYIGYSFQDNLLLDIIAELQQTLGERLPYSYALMPELKDDSVQAVKLRERRIVPLKLTAAKLVELLRKGVQPRLTPIKDRDGHIVIVKGSRKVISHRDLRSYSQLCTVMSEEMLSDIQPDEIEIRRDFFRGILDDWTGFVREWDFKREQYRTIFERVKKELQGVNVDDNKSILVTGAAGSGKMFTLRRIAFDTYKHVGNPVIILRPYYEEIDLKALSTLCEELSSLAVGKSIKSKPSRARVLIVMGAASCHIADFKIIPTFMKSRGIPVTVLGSARENEWEMACQGLSERVSDENIFRLSDEFESEDERIRFAQHINRLELVEGAQSDIEIARLIEEDYQNSFFASIYSLIDPARPTLEKKIQEEYENLSDLSRRAYLYVASLYQYSLPLTLELLVRTLNCSYEEFIQEIFETEAKRIICSVDAPLEGIYLGARHRIIAEKLIEKQIRDIDDLVRILGEILARVNRSNLAEVQLCRVLLIRCIGPNGTEKRLSVEQIRRLFGTAIDENNLEDSAILHHFGLFESDNKNQDLALDLVERARKSLTIERPLFFLRTERIENIYNTLGLIYSRKGQEAEDHGDIESAERLYSVATDYFSKAKSGELQTPHPYDCECRMYFYRAERVEDDRHKIALYAQALDIVDEAEENLPDESMPRLLELKAKIQEGLFGIDGVSQKISQMVSEESSEVNGILAHAKLALLNESAPRETREKALEMIKRIVASGNKDVSILRSYSRLHKVLYPNEKKELYSILRMRYELGNEKRNLSLLYELGVLAFTFTDYPASLQYFRNLERRSQGHPKRWGIYDYGRDKSGRLMEFQGTILRIESQTMGYVDVPEVRQRFRYLPYAQKFVFRAGENVTFNIGFNYRGWLAVDLSR